MGFGLSPYIGLQPYRISQPPITYANPYSAFSSPISKLETQNSLISAVVEPSPQLNSNF